MIKINNVTKIYKSGKNTITALKDINLFINEGEVVVFKGKSGSGKSTLLSLVSALLKPTQGDISVDKMHISKLSDDYASKFRLKNIGIIFQKYNLFPQFSVVENVALPLIPLNLHAKEMEKKLKNILEQFYLYDKKDQLVKSLSGGEQQRVAIARSLINEPKIILADEPTANLDKTLSLEFIEILKTLKDKKRTIIKATHDSLFFELDFVDKIIELQGGEICY